MDSLSRAIRKRLARLRRQVVVAVCVTAAVILGAWGGYKWVHRKTPLEQSQEALLPLQSSSGHTVFVVPFETSHGAGPRVTP